MQDKINKEEACSWIKYLQLHNIPACLANIFWRKIEFESHQQIQNLLLEREKPIKGIKIWQHTSFNWIKNKYYWCIRVVMHTSSESLTLHRDSTTQVKTLCERELSVFILVAPVLLLDSPWRIYLAAINIMLDFILKNKIPNYEKV